MKFTVSQSALQTALDIVSKGIGSNTTLPILSGIYLKAFNGMLELQSSDLTISIKHQIAANVEEEGETVVSGKVIQNIVKNLPDAAITFEGGERTLAVTCQRSSFRLNTLSAHDWAQFPEFDLEKTCELPSQLLSTMVDKVYRVTSKEASRPILQGISLTVEDNTIRLVATDSFRLAVCDSNTDTPAGESFSAIISGEVFHDVLSMRSMTEKVLIGTTDNQVVFQFGNTTHISRKIEGHFPDYKQLLPTSCTASVDINVEDFSAALKRVSVIALANPSVRFDVDADGKEVKLSASSPDQGESSEHIEAQIEGDSLSIALNYHYVFDCVNAAPSKDLLRLELQGPSQPAIFKSNGKVNYLYLLMPVRL